MNTRFNYVPPKKRDKSHDDEFYKWTLEKRIKVISNNPDGSVKDYIEEKFWKKEKCSWAEFIKSYNIGSVSDQVINHIEKGTPLMTAHTLPAGDYTKLEKGAQIKREMESKGISFDDLVKAVAAATQNNKTAPVSTGNNESEVVNNG